jgi:hypothetical protein
MRVAESFILYSVADRDAYLGRVKAKVRSWLRYGLNYHLTADGSAVWLPKCSTCWCGLRVNESYLVQKFFIDWHFSNKRDYIGNSTEIAECFRHCTVLWEKYLLLDGGCIVSPLWRIICWPFAILQTYFHKNCIGMHTCRRGGGSNGPRIEYIWPTFRFRANIALIFFSTFVGYQKNGENWGHTCLITLLFRLKAAVKGKGGLFSIFDPPYLMSPCLAAEIDHNRNCVKKLPMNIWKTCGSAFSICIRY